VGIESVPNGTRHLAYVFLDGKSHPYYVISIGPRSRILRDVVSTLPEVWVADFA
jgi:hypothetical protein